MIQHIVLLSFAEGFEAEQIKKIIDAVFSLKDVIPQIRSITAGTMCNNSDETEFCDGKTHGFVMIFDSEEDRDTYLFHPAHVQVAQELVIPALKKEGGIVVFDMKVDNVK